MAAAANVAPENQYFYEDVVYRMDKRGNVVFGIVMENDDLDLSEESSDNEENLPKRKKGEIRMIWHPSGVEELVNCKKVSTRFFFGPPASLWSVGPSVTRRVFRKVFPTWCIPFESVIHSTSDHIRISNE